MVGAPGGWPGRLHVFVSTGWMEASLRDPPAMDGGLRDSPAMDGASVIHLPWSRNEQRSSSRLLALVGFAALQTAHIALFIVHDLQCWHLIPEFDEMLNINHRSRGPGV